MPDATQLVGDRARIGTQVSRSLRQSPYRLSLLKPLYFFLNRDNEVRMEM